MKKSVLLLATFILSVGLIILLGIVIWQSPTSGQTLVAVLNIFMSWPVVIGAMGFSAGITYKQEISGFIKRISAFKAGGMEVTAQQETPTSIVEDEEKTLITLSPEKEQELKGQIDQLKKDLGAAIVEKDVIFSKMLTNLEQKEKETIEWKFKFLNVFLADSSKAFLSQLYKAIVPQHLMVVFFSSPAISADYEAIIKALKHHDLIKIDDIKAMVSLTALGKSFVEYLNLSVTSNVALTKKKLKYFTKGPSYPLPSEPPPER